jgi:hypothetical protein
MMKKKKLQKIKVKRVSVVLENDGRLHIEPYEKGYGVEGIVTIGKREKYKFTKDNK